MMTELEPGAPELVPPMPRLCRYLSEKSPQPMVAVEGITHLVIYLNPAFARLVGQDRNELIGRPFAEAVPEGAENGCHALLERVFRTGVPEILAEQEHRQARPRPVYWSYSVWAILGGDERIAGVMIQVTDATETALFRQQAVTMNAALLVSGVKQHELTEASQLFTAKMRAAVQTRDHFLAILSHELRNPLTAMSNGLQLLKMAGKDPGRADNSREMMERQLNQMVRLVDDLLDISRIAAGKLELRKERVNLATVLRDAAEASRPLIDRSGHELTVALPADPIWLDADPTRLAQVFLNLLNNAAKYSEPGGRIRLGAVVSGQWIVDSKNPSDSGLSSLTTDHSPLTTPPTSSLTNDHFPLTTPHVVVSIRDTGIGIPAVHLPQVFDVFVQVDTSWQRAQGGLGIGLSLVKELVELHGGRVEARSDGIGRGSEFVVRLPVAVAAAAVAEPPPTLPATTGGPRRRVLVVDDNRDAAESLAMMLEYMGHDVRTAHDGETGIAAVVEFGPEVVLMDLGMPKMGGLEAARRIRAAPRGDEPLLVALTGWGADEDRRRTHEAGFDRHLVKPVDLEALAESLAAERAIP